MHRGFGEGSLSGYSSRGPPLLKRMQHINLRLLRISYYYVEIELTLVETRRVVVMEGDMSTQVFFGYISP